MDFCKVPDSWMIERIQEWALHAVFMFTTQACKALLIQAKLPTLYNWHLQDIAILIYKVKNGLQATSCIQLYGGPFCYHSVFKKIFVHKCENFKNKY